jgi:hypothetical protein
VVFLAVDIHRFLRRALGVRSNSSRNAAVMKSMTAVSFRMQWSFTARRRVDGTRVTS